MLKRTFDQAPTFKKKSRMIVKRNRVLFLICNFNIKFILKLPCTFHFLSFDIFSFFSLLFFFSSFFLHFGMSHDDEFFEGMLFPFYRNTIKSIKQQQMNDFLWCRKFCSRNKMKSSEKMYVY